MKKIISFLFLIAVMFTANAQNGKAYTFATIAGDTLINTDTAGRIITASAGYNSMAISVNVTKLTGSAITGTCYLYQSLDGKNFGAATDTAAFVGNQQFTANLPLGSIIPTYTQTATFRKITTPSVYYLVVAISSGTVTEKVQFSYTARKYLTGN